MIKTKDSIWLLKVLHHASQRNGKLKRKRNKQTSRMETRERKTETRKNEKLHNNYGFGIRNDALTNIQPQTMNKILKRWNFLPSNVT